MTQLTGNEPGLLLYYPLDEGSGTTAMDQTANHYNGTLTSTLAGDQPAWVADPGPGAGRNVATFTSADPSATAASFTATVTWGDGHTSPGTVAPDGRGGFTVSGSNTYAQAGTYPVTVTVTDAFNGTGTGQGTADVQAGVFHFLVTGFPSPIEAGTAGTFTVTALDASGGTFTGYRGTVAFTSSDPRADLPAPYTFTDADNGTHSFTATLQTAGSQSITATDTADPSFTGTQSGIRVVPTPPVVTGTTVTPTAGRTFGVAAGFDGTDDYIQVPSTLVVGGAITVEAWVKSANVFANWARVIDFANGPSMDNIIFGWMANTGHLYFETYRNGQTIALVTPTVFPQNQWVHVAAVNDGNGMGFIYINGVLAASGPQMIPATVTRTQQWVARSNYPADSFFQGSMEELHIWNTVRSASEVQTDMTQLTGNEPGLAAYYPVDEASGNTAFDRTANHYNATLTSTLAGDQPAWVADPGPGPGRNVATFTSGDQSATASSFTATITWGDGHTSPGTVAPDGRGGFTVSGSNTYDQPGTYPTTVTVTDAFGGTGMGQGTATVTAGPGSPGGGTPGGLAVNAGGAAPLAGGSSSSAAGGGAGGSSAPATAVRTANGVTGYTGPAPAPGADGQAGLPAGQVFGAFGDGRDSFSAVGNTPGAGWVEAIDALMASLHRRRDDPVV
jgi:hypothetical protein